VDCDFKRDICDILKQQVDVMNFFRYHAKWFKPSRWSVEVSIAKTQNVCFTWYAKMNFRYELHGIFRSGSKSGSWYFLLVRNRYKRPSAQSSWSLKMFIHLSSQYEVTKHGLWEKFYQGYEDPYRTPSFWAPHRICKACLCSNQNIYKIGTIVELPTILHW